MLTETVVIPFWFFLVPWLTLLIVGAYTMYLVVTPAARSPDRAKGTKSQRGGTQTQTPNHPGSRENACFLGDCATTSPQEPTQSERKQPR